MGYPMAMKSSSVCALENNENKVGPILWDTLYLILSLQTDQIVLQLSETVLTLRFIYADSFNTFNIENYLPCRGKSSA